MKTNIKPTVKLIGTDGNIFSLLGRAANEMERQGFTDQAKEMTEKIFNSGSYAEALSIIKSYCVVK